MSISRYSVLTAALIGSTLALSSTLISKPAFAGSASTNMQVSANVPAICTVTTTPMNFGTYVVGNDSTAQATITTTCNSVGNVTVALNEGLHNGSGMERHLQNNANSSSYLNYFIFQDPGLSTPWGDGNPDGGGNPLTFTSDGNAKVLTAYGKIPSNQNDQLPISLGTFNDTVTVTVTY